jgi:hypothetical protein
LEYVLITEENPMVENTAMNLSVSAEQLLIALNLIWVSGFTLVTSISYREMKAKLATAVSESACKERKEACCRLHKEETDSLGRSIDTERKRIDGLIEDYKRHSHSDSGKVEGGVVL